MVSSFEPGEMERLGLLDGIEHDEDAILFAEGVNCLCEKCDASLDECDDICEEDLKAYEGFLGRILLMHARSSIARDGGTRRSACPEE